MFSLFLSLWVQALLKVSLYSFVVLCYVFHSFECKMRNVFVLIRVRLLFALFPSTRLLLLLHRPPPPPTTTITTAATTTIPITMISSSSSCCCYYFTSFIKKKFVLCVFVVVGFFSCLSWVSLSVFGCLLLLLPYALAPYIHIYIIHSLLYGGQNHRQRTQCHVHALTQQPQQHINPIDKRTSTTTSLHFLRNELQRIKQHLQHKNSSTNRSVYDRTTTKKDEMPKWISVCVWAWV